MSVSIHVDIASSSHEESETVEFMIILLISHIDFTGIDFFKYVSILMPLYIIVTLL